MCLQKRGDSGQASICQLGVGAGRTDSGGDRDSVVGAAKEVQTSAGGTRK